MTGVLHIVLAMKPVEGNFASNALKHGVAGINIEGCRVGNGKVSTHSRGGNTAFPKRPTETSVEESGRKTRQDLVDMSERSGRFPANVVLGHSEGCRLVGMKKVKGHNGYPNGPGDLWSKKYQEESGIAKQWNNASTKADNKPWLGYADADGKETVDNWECVEGCPARMMGEQSGELKSGRGRLGVGHTDHGKDGGVFGAYSGRKINQEFGNDTGTAARFFKQVSEFREGSEA